MVGLGRGISNLVKAATYFAIIKAVSDKPH
jgi:hypothetical protein